MKHQYIKPNLKVVSFLVEHGFAFTDINNSSFQLVEPNDARTTLTGTNFEPASGDGDNTNTFGNTF